MAQAKTKRRPAKARQVQHPRQRQPARRRRWWEAAALAALIAVVVGVAVIGFGGGTKKVAPPPAGLPQTSDYHSLLVDANNPRELLLGTHQGLYRSSDGGRSWVFQALSGQDAMNLARPGGAVVWTAGHQVLAKSTDGGETWADVRPVGLPGLDVHGFAIDPAKPTTLYAAIAGQGLYRSRDGGGSFALVSHTVGPGVMALAITPSGGILAGEMQQGLMASSDGGRSWRRVLRAQLMGLAINPREPARILATGPGILLSTNGGRTWKQVLKLPEGAGPVAWSPSKPKLAYAVGFDSTLYRSDDGGASWRPLT